MLESVNAGANASFRENLTRVFQTGGWPSRTTRHPSLLQLAIEVTLDKFATETHFRGHREVGTAYHALPLRSTLKLGYIASSVSKWHVHCLCSSFKCLLQKIQHFQFLLLDLRDIMYSVHQKQNEIKRLANVFCAHF